MKIKSQLLAVLVPLLLAVTMVAGRVPFILAQSPPPTPTATPRPTLKTTPRPATSPSPKPTASPTASASAQKASVSEIALHETTQKLRERLQKILGEQDTDGDGTNDKAAYIGEVTRLNEEAMTLKTLESSEIIPIDGTTILLKRTQRIAISDVTVGDWVTVIGTREKNRSIKPEVLMVQSTSLRPREHLVTIGVVTGTTNSGLTLTPRGKTESIAMTVTKNTKLVDAQDETITLRQLPKDVAVIAVAYGTTSGGWELGTLKTTMAMAEYKSSGTPSPTPRPTLAPRRATPRPTASPTPTP